jgi:hypothetical protein
MMTWIADADLSPRMQRSRLNATSAVFDHLDDPRMKSALARYFANREPAIAKLEAFTASRSDAAGRPASGC